MYEEFERKNDAPIPAKCLVEKDSSATNDSMLVCHPSPILVTKFGIEYVRFLFEEGDPERIDCSFPMRSQGYC